MRNAIGLASVNCLSKPAWGKRGKQLIRMDVKLGERISPQNGKRRR